MTDLPPSRRDFLRRSGAALGGAWLGLNLGPVLAAAEQARDHMAGGRGWTNLTEAEALTLAAVAGQIYPADDTPGAVEIGAVHFMDAAFGGFMAGSFPTVREGLADLDVRAGQGGFASLEFQAQTSVLKAVEETRFFGQVHFLTLCGVFALPEYGGNRDLEGWKQLGFESRHAWQPPFGYYDAQAAKGDDA